MSVRNARNFPVLYQENKNIAFHLKHNKYPYILEVKIEYDFASLFFWPGWYPQQKIPVLHSEYKLIQEKPVDYNSYSIGKKIEPIKIVEKGALVSLWTLENIPELKEEDFMPPENIVQQAVMFSPKEFFFGKSHGIFSDWNKFADWYRRLTKGKYALSNEARKKVLNLIKDKEDPHEIITILYKYLQKQTRYVAVYLDIGGWEPHSAFSVFEKKYGDCKDLTTLMVTMLKLVKIKAYPALVLTRNKGVVYPDFIANQFNHSIAFVPLKEDSLWIECTADFIDITDMPPNIEDTNALVVKEHSGEIIRTPKAPMEANKWVSSSRMTYHNSALSVNGQIVTTGKQKHFFKGLFATVKKADEKIILQKIFGYNMPNLKIDHYMYQEEGSADKSYVVQMDGVYNKAVVHTGKRLFINPNIYNRKTDNNLPDEEEERTFPVHFPYPYQDIDTVYIKIPHRYKLEIAPKPIVLDIPQAYYKTEYSFDDQRLKYIRKFCYKNNEIAISDYQQYRDFLQKVIKNDAASFIFKK